MIPDQMANENKLILKAAKGFSNYDEMYKVVDYINKNIKDKGVMLGLTKDKENNKMNINIYEF